MPPTAIAFHVAEMPLAKAVNAIRKGLPPAAFDGVAKALHLSTEELAKKLGISVRTLRDKKQKVAPLSRENSEKLVRTAKLQRLARTIFTTDEAVSQWLAAPAPALNGVRPLDLIDTDLGAREVEAVLHGIAYGNVM